MKVLFRAETIRQDYKEETEGLKYIDKVWYAIGNLVEIGSHNVILPAKQKVETCGEDAMVDIHYEIKPDTKAIHFEDMLDSESNPIFASLDSETGKGGDIMSLKESYRRTQTHTGDNIPMGSYTEPLELEIKNIESVIIMKDGIISAMCDSSEEYTTPLSHRLDQDKINDLETLLLNGYGLEAEDIEYIQEEYKLGTCQDIINYFKSKIIGIKNDN